MDAAHLGVCVVLAVHELAVHRRVGEFFEHKVQQTRIAELRCADGASAVSGSKTWAYERKRIEISTLAAAQ